MGTPSAIVFDFDGVLIESLEVKGDAFRKIYSDFGSDIAEKVLRYHLENGGMNRKEKFLYCHKTYLNHELTEKELFELSERFSCFVLEGVVSSPWSEGTLEFLKSFSREIPLYIASATPQVELDEICRRRHISQYFESIFGSPISKKAAIRTVLNDLRLVPTDLVFIGDARVDLEAARDTGVRFILKATRWNQDWGTGLVRVKSIKELRRYVVESD